MSKFSRLTAMLICVSSLLTSMQVLGSYPVSCALSAMRPDDPPNRGVALVVENLIPLLCSESCLGGDSGGGAEQKEDAGCETPRSAMDCDQEDVFSRHASMKHESQLKS